MTSPIAVYVHTPFCPSKCGYCDFNSYAMTGEIMERTTRAIIAEIKRSPLAGIPAKTIFFGGGTPTYLESRQLLSILEATIETHPPIAGCEISSEANPGTVDIPKFKAMRAAGFNRISLGAQSFLDSDLLQLDRVHKAGDIERAVAAAREAGFESLNLDLMFALPNQNIRAWKQNLDRAFSLAPDHLSLYCLTIEQNTAFYKKHLKGQLNLPDDEAQVAMYEECLDRCEELGLKQYEISNFSRPGYECRHNLCYWYGEAYAGYGPGAVGSIPGEAFGIPDAEQVRYTNLKHPDGYCTAVETNQRLDFEHEALTPELLTTERIMLGLRLNEGIPSALIKGKRAVVEDLLRRDWVNDEGDQLKLTREGRHFCSEVALALI